MAHAHKKIDSRVTNIKKDSHIPAHKMMSPFDNVEHFFNQLRNRDWMHSFDFSSAVPSHIPMFSDGKLPQVDIVDNDIDLLIRAALPGVDKKDLDISMTDNSVTIKASTNYEDKEEKSDYFRSEITHGEYSRTIGLPADVDIDKAKSNFKNGVLELTVPKMARSQRRNIKIN